MTPTQLVLIATNAATQGIEKYSTGLAEILFQTRRPKVDFAEELTVDDIDCRIWQCLIVGDAVHPCLVHVLPCKTASLRVAMVENCNIIPLALFGF